ncbi:uncharacterized protein LOC121816219 isoform X4 [Ovis aries]|uniref:uncharacterized protein LOC121816219 isoform X4 n=1 Tax=Ovis aries TaxID=9940 RepID=UPI002952729F|nr:uncharacterized protein LOC121816219 isoform X4 [Ovis aries]
MEIILELQQSAQPHNTEAETQIDRQISQLVEGASGWQLWAIGCWTTIGKTEMEQGQKIAHFNAAQPLLSHGHWKFCWDNPPNEFEAFYSNGGASGKESIYQCRRHKRRGLDPWVGNTTWKKVWQPTPVFVPGESHGLGGLAGYRLWSHTESNVIQEESY